MVYEGYKVVGVYKRKDGREHICLSKEGIVKNISYPKYLMENHLGRYLTSEETVDHIDRDFTNNSLTNLQVLNRREHSKLDVLRLKPKPFECPYCNKNFILEGVALHNAKTNRDRGKFGTFCSRSCAGKYSREVQLGIRIKEQVLPIEVEYYHYKEKIIGNTLQ